MLRGKLVSYQAAVPTSEGITLPGQEESRDGSLWFLLQSHGGHHPERGRCGIQNVGVE